MGIYTTKEEIADAIFSIKESLASIASGFDILLGVHSDYVGDDVFDEARAEFAALFNGEATKKFEKLKRQYPSLYGKDE